MAEDTMEGRAANFASILTPLWHGTPDDRELLRLLTAAGCPIVCVGHRDPDGMDWHEECEERGRAAFKILRPPIEIPDLNGGSS